MNCTAPSCGKDIAALPAQPLVFVIERGGLGGANAVRNTYAQEASLVLRSERKEHAYQALPSKRPRQPESLPSSQADGRRKHLSKFVANHVLHDVKVGKQVGPPNAGAVGLQQSEEPIGCITH